MSLSVLDELESPWPGSFQNVTSGHEHCRWISMVHAAIAAKEGKIQRSEAFRTQVTKIATVEGTPGSEASKFAICCT